MFLSINTLVSKCRHSPAQPGVVHAIDAVISQTGRSPDALAYLPMVGRKSFWPEFLDPVTADVLAFMPLDSF